MTALHHVPKFSAPRSISPRILRANQRARRQRPACDTRCACPRSSTICSMAAASCTDRPARDNGGSAPPAFDSCAFRSRSRCRRWRCRSSSRALSRSAARRFLRRRARRRSRHFALHVFCVFAADAAGTYHCLHSLQRCRSRVTGLFRFMPERSHPTRSPASFPPAYNQMDLLTAIRWISVSPAPKDRGHLPKGRLNALVNHLPALVNHLPARNGGLLGRGVRCVAT